jgi:hypothetical protein
MVLSRAVWTRAQGYHSKQLAAFVARFRTENAVSPA